MLRPGDIAIGLTASGRTPFVAGALARHEGAASIGLIVALGALVLAGLALLWGPLALVALLGVIWLGSARRRRAQRKYEGLRVLR